MKKVQFYLFHKIIYSLSFLQNMMTSPIPSKIVLNYEEYKFPKFYNPALYICNRVSCKYLINKNKYRLPENT